jgi:hypothetical protein
LKNRIIAVLHANNPRQQFLSFHKTNFPKQKTSIYNSSSASQFPSFLLSFFLSFTLASSFLLTLIALKKERERKIKSSPLSVFSCRYDRCKNAFLFFFVVVAQRANKQAWAPQMLLLLLPDALNR